MASSEPPNPLVTVPNPFYGMIIQDVWQKLTFDVSSIHRNAFDQCLAALQNVQQGRGDSLLIQGSAGAGKTHLISRLQQQLFATSKDAPDRVLRCVFVAVRLQSSPTQLWQHVRQRLGADLLRQEENVSQLQRLMAHQVAAARGERPRQWVSALRVLTQMEGESISEHLQEVAAKLDLERDLFVVLDHLVHRRFAFDAAAWLKGDSLPDPVLEKLGVGREESDDREEDARRTVTALCRLAGETLPIVFCFDQLESLQRYPNDHEALFRFGRMAADLADADENVLIISCLQSAYVEELYHSVREADRDRAFKRRIALEPLTRAQMEALVLQRLLACQELSKLRAGEAANPLWPLDSKFLDEIYERTPRTPRKLLAACADRFESLRQGRPAKDADLPGFLENAFAERRREALEQHRPEDSKQTLVHGLPMLWFTLQRAPLPVTLSEVQRSGADVVLRSATGEHNLLVCNEQSMNGLAARLRRLVRNEDAAGKPAIIARDARLKISSTAKKTREYLRELERRGYRFLEPTLEALAALEALRSLLSDARSGDLNVRGETVSESVVARWFLEHLDPRLMELVEDIESPTSTDPDAELERDLAEFLLDEHVVGLSIAATVLGTSEDRIRALSERRPDRFGLLQGPPAVLFEYVSDEALPASEKAP